uniref:Derlin n=1 Tax=Fibrocapsa japonica TaxID=94617 RepID=A0A6U1QM22_9STRA
MKNFSLGFKAVVFLAALSSVATASHFTDHRYTSLSILSKQSSSLAKNTFDLDILRIRGGVKKATPKEEEAEEDEPKKENAIAEAFKNVLPATRVYLSIALVLTVVHMTGMVDAQQLLSLNLVRTFKNLEIWRPITSTCFMGPPSMQMAGNIYFLVKYGQELEANDGTLQHVFFLMTQLVLLSILGGVLGAPFMSSSLITAQLWCCSRLDPMSMVGVGFMGLAVPHWLLPFALMGIDILQAQSIAAGIPHVFGFLTGHFYHFFYRIYPLLGGRKLLEAPNFLKRMLDPAAKAEVFDKRASKLSSKRKLSSRDEEEEEEEEEPIIRPKKASSSKSKKSSSSKSKSSRRVNK